MKEVRAGRALDTATTLALVAVTLLSVRGMRGLLAPETGLGRLVVAALVVHALSWAFRRFGVPGGFALGFGAVFLLVAWLGVPSTTVAGFPGSGTWRAVGDGMGSALEAIRTTPLNSRVPEPLEVVEGRLLIALLVVGMCSLLADQAAFRVRGSFLALAPSFSLLLVGAVRGTSQYRVGAVVAYLVATLAFLILHRALVSAEAAPSIPHTLSLPSVLAGLAPGAALLVLAAVAGAVLVAPQVPGFGKPAVVGATATGGRQGGSGNGTISISPTVDIRPSLVERPATELFTVRTDLASYWRLASLDDFDGRTWRVSTSTDSFPDVVSSSSRMAVSHQEFELGPLSSDWLPAAYRARSVTGPGRLAHDDSYVIHVEGQSSVNAHYQVESLVVIPSERDLVNSPPVRASSGAATRYLGLPVDLSESIVDEARRVTAGAAGAGPYAVARTLQDWFRDNFTYDQKVPAGNGARALERFVFTTKRGYCEQFAGAYAVMARALGLPARVAVGFTSGELRDDGRYHVQGTNAHAWPEVYLQGAGWVSFEPTPGRGMPGAEQYTGVAPAQAPPIRGRSSEPSTGTTAPRSAPTTTPNVTPGGPVTTAGSGPAPTTPGSVPTSPVGEPQGGAAEESSSALVLALAAMALGVILATALRRHRRRERLGLATDTNAQVLAAWEEAADAMADCGLGRRPHETMLDHARRAATDGRLPAEVGEPVLVLAGRAGSAAYGTSDLDSETVEECRQAAGTVTAAARGATPLPRRVLHTIDPRSRRRHRLRR